MEKVYFLTNESGLLQGISSTRGSEQDQELYVENDHEVLTNPFIFRFTDGKLIKDVEYQKRLVAEAEEARNKPTDEEMNAIALMQLTNIILGGK